MIFGIVETQSAAGLYTAIATAITPLVLLFSLWVQRIWARSAIKIAKRAAEAADISGEKVRIIAVEQAHAFMQLQATMDTTHSIVNSQRGIILKQISLLSRTYATMARNVSRKSHDETDLEVALLAENSAEVAEYAYKQHEESQSILDDKIAKTESISGIKPKSVSPPPLPKKLIQ